MSTSRSMVRFLDLDGPASFVPTRAEVSEWKHIEPLFGELDRWPLRTRTDLEAWLLAQSELGAAIDEAHALRYIAMTSDTDDVARERAYLDFVTGVLPLCKPRWHRLKQRYAASSQRGELPPERYGVFDRSVINQVELFQEANIPLEVEESRLAQRFQKISGSMTVRYRGRERTLPQMSRFLEEHDRATRQGAWELVAHRRLQDREELEALFDQLLFLRHQIAANAGFESYREFAFRELERFSYTPADCLRFHEAVEQVVVPLKHELDEERRRGLGLDRLRPWDLSVDPHGGDRLRPFETAAQLRDGCAEIFSAVDPELGEQFALIAGQGMLDLESRKGKAPGGYQFTLQRRRMPFIFMNAAGVQRDVETLLHEGGHAFHALASREEPLLKYRNPPLEFAEVASMSMEMLALPFLEVFYSAADASRARRTHVERVASLFCWVATIDAFQHWLYTHPGHSHTDRRDTWRALRRRFGGLEDYGGLEEVLDAEWHRQGHLFCSPFYYIEYAIAQMGALHVWLSAKQDYARAVGVYRRGLALGGSRPLPELFAAAGALFELSERALAPLVRAVAAELRRG